MPLYEYECVKCGKRTEKIEPVNGPHLKKCPKCGGKVERAVSAPAIQFKGTGWYVTDYAGKSPAKDAAASSEKSEGEKKEAPKESAAKESKDSADKKGAKKK
ncbi:MAG TPA: FmdB family zinc ribbon protein [Candidatus Acidoferrum sp.]|nr:FmdB family zinc ribbon protein [Candidatus Acidoferrum sp.]